MEQLGEYGFIFSYLTCHSLTRHLFLHFSFIDYILYIYRRSRQWMVATILRVSPIMDSESLNMMDECLLPPGFYSLEGFVINSYIYRYIGPTSPLYCDVYMKFVLT